MKLLSLAKLYAIQSFSSWTIHHIIRSLCKISAFAGTVVFCIFLILGKYETLNYPLLITATTCSFLYVSPPNRRIIHHDEIRHGLFAKFKKGGDTNMTGLTILLVFVPTLGYLILSLIKHLKGVTFTLEDFPHGHIANVFGKAAAMTMSFFLIPVSKHSIILKACGIDPTHALKLHISAGFIAACSGLIHGLYWFCIWIFRTQEDLWTIILPPRDCWTSKECNPVLVQFTGVLLGFSFIFLSLSSLWWVRRNYYTFFITAHVTFAFIILYLLVMHYYKMILYIGPSLLYYFVSSIPIWIESVIQWMNGGIHVTNVNHIPDANGCVEISILNQTIEKRYDYDPMLMLQMNCGKYVKICVPELSKVWHPFSFYHLNDSRDIKLMLKCDGPFTQTLYQRLSISSDESYPKILVEGFYGGENLLTKASLHETVVIFAGGVGMASYLTLLSLLSSSCRNTQTQLDDTTTYQTSTQVQTNKKIIVHWLCRDEGLITYFTESHFKKLGDNYCSGETISDFPHIQIVIHHTKKNDIQTTRSEQEDETKDDESQDLSQQNAFDVGSFSWGKKGYLFENIIQAIVFSCMLWTCQWLVEFFYNNVQGKHVVVYKRTFIVLVIPAFIAVSTLLFLLLMRLYAICYRYINLCRYQHLTTEKDNIIEIPNKSTSMGSLSDVSVESQSYPDVKIEHVHGRPDISAVINEICDAENDIGLFMCLPSSLKQSIKDILSTKQCGKDQCALYEEISEL